MLVCTCACMWVWVCACLCVLNCHSLTVSKKILVDVREVTMLVIHSVQAFYIGTCSI